MADDLGLGDVVEAVRDLLKGGPPCFYKGHRYIVDSLTPGGEVCTDCGGTDDLEIVGMISEHWTLCPCDFRKIGGSKADTVRQFSEDLNIKTPVPVPEHETA